MGIVKRTSQAERIIVTIVGIVKRVRENWGGEHNEV